MTEKITYKTSGVDIDKANDFVKAIQGPMLGTMNAQVIRRKGSFGALFALGLGKYKNPVLVSSTDGVGTKLLIAKVTDKHDTVGIDLVAMNVNDILCTGARPLFFLDYIACGKLRLGVLKDVFKGIALGCRQAGCSLIGGETAEMPGMYAQDDYDLAGFTVGIVEKDRLIDGAAIKNHDRVIGLASSGLHSNGFSLVRKVFSIKEQKALAHELLKPTRIYVEPVLKVLEKFDIHGMAHMTGGAFYEKLTKILTNGLCFVIDKSSWPRPNIFQKIQKQGKIKEPEMFRTFNMGIGYVLVVSPPDAAAVQAFMKKQRVSCFDIGEVVRDNQTKLILE